jgi:hypothetical protein
MTLARSLRALYGMWPRLRGWGAVGMLSLLAAPALAPSAAVAQPNGIFSVFAQCPASTPGDVECIFGEVTGGELSIGAVRVPIDRSLVLQGGDIPVGYPEDPSEIEFFLLPAKNGRIISNTGLEIPGGLQRFVDVNCASLGAVCGVSASVEVLLESRDRPVLNERYFVTGTGAGMILPVRIHLNNPFLGGQCYIGSELTPLQLRLTTGETHPPAGFKPLHGSGGDLRTLQEKGQLALRASGVSLVDNTFAVPGASEGCGLFRSPIDRALKIPDKAGENAAVLNATLLITSSEAVLASETW